MVGQVQTETTVGAVRIPALPADFKIFPMDKDVGFIENHDIAAIQKPFVDQLIGLDEQQRASGAMASLAEGGQKIRNLDALGSPVFDALNNRAKALFMKVTGAKAAIVDDCWANVFRSGEYTMPHSHKRAVASVVYALESGDEDAWDRDPMNGLLTFVDPRLERCCIGRPGYVSTPFHPPKAVKNYMVIFPAHITHMVTPYVGTRPRISIAWNIGPTEVPGELRHDGGMR